MSMPPDSEVINYHYSDPSDYENQFVPEEPEEQEQEDD